MKTLISTLVLALLSAFLALPIQGCAPLFAALPDVIAAITDGAQIIDVIEHFVANYFVMHPDAEAQKKVAEAINRCRLSLNLALRTAQASKELNDQQVDAAFNDFKAAYIELLGLTKPYGVKPAGGKMMTARGDSLEVPEPLAFHPLKGRVK